MVCAKRQVVFPDTLAVMVMEEMVWKNVKTSKPLKSI